MAEREPVTYVAVKGEMENDEDIEASIDGWRDSLKGAEAPGLVRAYRLPFDANGIPSYNAKNQVRLGSWPIDHYTFDELCGMIVKEYMFPNEQQMAVRLIGTRQGQRGIEFNKIVMLQKPRSDSKEGNAAAPESMAGIMKAITESNERMLRLVQEMRGGPVMTDAQPTNQMTAMMQFAAMSRAMMEPMTAMMAPLMSIIAGRPATSESPTANLKGLVETLAVLDGLRGGQGMGVSNSDGNSAASIFRSVADVAAPLLTIAAKQGGPPAHARRALPAPAATPSPGAGASVRTGQAASPPVSPGPVAGGVDLSRPSAPSAPAAPAVDLSQPSPQPTGNESMFIQAKKLVDGLIEAAQRGVNPKEMAQSFFNNTMLAMDDGVYEMLCTQLEAPNFLDQISLLNPNARSYGIFFNELQQALLQFIHAENEAAEEDFDDVADE